MNSQPQNIALPAGTIVHQYQIESVLGMGGFGIVYKAKHMRLNSYVAIKEYLPQHCASREGVTVYPQTEQYAEEFQVGIDSFLREAQQLVVFDDHPNIIRCKDFFDDNGTAYLVMNLEQGLELAEILQNHAEAGHSLSEPQIRALIGPILDGLSFIHSEGVLHRDIKPANIFVRMSDNRPLLIDFGAAKQNFQQSQKTQYQMHTPGYAPLEQLGSEGELGPWTDIYAVGAMIWKIIMNTNPPAAQDRVLSVMQGKEDPALEAIENVKYSYSTVLINAMQKAMAIKISDRFQTAEEFKAALESVDRDTEIDTDTSTEKETDTDVTSADVTVKKNRLKILAGFSCLAFICLIAIFIAQSNDKTSMPEDLTSSSSNTIKISLTEELDIIYQLITKAELTQSEMLSNQSVINTLRSLGELDANTQKNLDLLLLSIEKNKVAIEDKMLKARERTLILAEKRELSFAEFDSIIRNEIELTAVHGNYEKSDFFKALHNLIKDTSEFATKIEKQSLIKRKLTI
ncbi:MAG: serine/threonine-protein kinase [Aliiglaciecola sp.]|uniref:serine/threonine protein kinase n=1 Tax=Aliiglaciecola sp. TaxID=1872441 RepID=UPI003298A782